jgi:glutathione synthase
MAEMSKTPLSLAFVMDPLESIDIEADTTFVLMLEAQQRGHEVLFVDPSDIGVAGGLAVAQVTPVTLRREQDNHFDWGETRTVVFEDDIDVVLQRKDPPVDAEYVTVTQILSLCRRALVLNRPEAILSANEKLFALHFADLMPATQVTSSIRDLLEFMAKLGGEMIVKPLDGRGGEGIFHLRQDDRNLRSILEQSTRFETVRIMAQRYLPDVRKGDKRILLLDGRPIGAVLRVPAEDETRANLHVGGSAAASELDETDRQIVERLSPRLRREGLFFVGIDVIGGRLTEVNVTSPTGVQEINALEKRRLEAEIIDAVEKKVAQHRQSV